MSTWTLRLSPRRSEGSYFCRNGGVGARLFGMSGALVGRRVGVGGLLYPGAGPRGSTGLNDDAATAFVLNCEK